MTQNTSVSKTDESTGTDRRAFLRALYGSAPDELYLELRCIHPTTGEVRTLWGRMGDKRGLAAVLKQADKLNSEGFGLYFAPCLRKGKSGNADATAWVPALWIDIDSTDARNLEKLKAFDPAPSFIVSSGGGWHAYWLLEQLSRCHMHYHCYLVAAGTLTGCWSSPLHWKPTPISKDRRHPARVVYGTGW